MAILVGFEREVDDGLPKEVAAGWRIVQLTWQLISCGQILENGTRTVSTTQTVIKFDAPSCGHISVG